MLLKVINKKLPCQAVVNSMHVNETPTQLASSYIYIHTYMHAYIHPYIYIYIYIYIYYIYKHVQSYLPSKEDAELYDLVKIFQPILV